jgi:hypothetical protein
LAVISAPGGGFEERIPFDAKFVRDSIRTIRPQQTTRCSFEIEISLGVAVGGGGDPCIQERAEAGITDPGYSFATKRELELPKQRHTRSFACSGDR